MHFIRALREAVVTRVTGLVTTGANVYETRVDPVAAGVNNALCVFVDTDPAETVTLDVPEIHRRDADVRVEAVVTAADNADDQIDQIALEVEVALAASLTVLGKTVVLSYLGRTTENRGDGQDLHSVGVMRITTDLYVAANTPDALFM